MKNKLLGILFAVGLGALGTIPWIVLGYFGFFASLAGFVIGLAAWKGYTLGNGKFDTVGRITIAVFILLAIPAAELVAFFLLILKEGLSFAQALTLTPTYFFSNLGEFTGDFILGYFMAFLGTYRFLFGKEQPASEKTGSQAAKPLIK